MGQLLAGAMPTQMSCDAIAVLRLLFPLAYGYRQFLGGVRKLGHGYACLDPATTYVTILI